MGQFDRALELHRQAIAMSPDDFFAWLDRGYTYFAIDNWNAALNDFDKALSLIPEAGTIFDIGVVYARMGKRAEALKVIDELHEQSKIRYILPFAYAEIYFNLGDSKRGFEYLEQAYRERSYSMVTPKTRFFNPLRSDPRFQAIYKKVGLPP
jgi:tetratricopeptide (TPR) repeat protein